MTNDTNNINNTNNTNDMYYLSMTNKGDGRVI